MWPTSLQTSANYGPPEEDAPDLFGPQGLGIGGGPGGWLQDLLQGGTHFVRNGLYTPALSEMRSRSEALQEQADQGEKSALDAYGASLNRPMPPMRTMGFRTPDLIGGILSLLAGPRGLAGFLQGKTAAMGQLQQRDDMEEERRRQASQAALQMALQKMSIDRAASQRKDALTQALESRFGDMRKADMAMRMFRAGLIQKINPATVRSDLAGTNQALGAAGQSPLPAADQQQMISAADADMQAQLKRQMDAMKIKNDGKGLMDLWKSVKDNPKLRTVVAPLVMGSQEFIDAAAALTPKEQRELFTLKEGEQQLPIKLEKGRLENKVLSERAKQIIQGMAVGSLTQENLRRRIKLFDATYQDQVAKAAADLANAQGTDRRFALNQILGLYKSQLGDIQFQRSRLDPGNKKDLPELDALDQQATEIRKSMDPYIEQLRTIAGGGSGPKGEARQALLDLAENIQQAFPGLRPDLNPVQRNIAGTDTPSEHSAGDATDVFGDASQLNSMAQWATSQPGVATVIYRGQIWSREKRYWHKYTGQNPHNDHVHVDFGLLRGQFVPTPDPEMAKMLEEAGPVTRGRDQIPYPKGKTRRGNPFKVMP